MDCKLKAGDKFQAIEKGQGLKKGEKVKVLALCECISNEPEKLSEIAANPYRPSHMSPNGHHSECELEGLCDLDEESFITHFCEINKAKKCKPDSIIRRVEFKYV